MSEKSKTRARLEPDGRVVEVNSDGSTQELPDATDGDRLRNTTDDEIDTQIGEDPNVSPILDEVFWEHAQLVIPDVIDRYKKRYGRNYQVRTLPIFFLLFSIQGRTIALS